MQQFAAVLITFALLGAAVWLRKRAGAQTARKLAVIESAGLGPGRGIAVVRAGSKRLLVGFGKESVQLLADLPLEDWAENGPEPEALSAKAASH